MFPTPFTENLRSELPVRQRNELRSHKVVYSYAQSVLYRHVPGDANPADVGSHGCDGDKLGESWRRGPDWLTKEEMWPEDFVTVAMEDTEVEAVKIREVLATAVAGDNDPMQMLLEKYRYCKLLRITVVRPSSCLCWQR